MFRIVYLFFDSFKPLIKLMLMKVTQPVALKIYVISS